MIFKNLKLRFIFLLILFIGATEGFSQSTVTSDSIATISYKSERNVAVYSFKPHTEYNEFKTAQRISRFNSITGDNATVEYKKKKVILRVNPELTKDRNLDSLLEVIVKIHGYSKFELN